MDIEELIHHIVTLPIQDRRKIIQVVLKTIEQEQNDVELTEQKQATIKRRIDEIESREATLIPLSEVKNEMRKRFPKKHHYPL